MFPVIYPWLTYVPSSWAATMTRLSWALRRNYLGFAEQELETPPCAPENAITSTYPRPWRRTNYGGDGSAFVPFCASFVPWNFVDASSSTAER